MNIIIILKKNLILNLTKSCYHVRINFGNVLAPTPNTPPFLPLEIVYDFFFMVQLHM